VPPRQVLVDAKIFEVRLTGAFQAGVRAYLKRRTSVNRAYQPVHHSAASQRPGLPSRQDSSWKAGNCCCFGGKREHHASQSAVRTERDRH
jgi:hypothetical protein